MYIIQRLPQLCKDFLRKIRHFFENDPYSVKYASRLIVAIASLNGRVSLSKIAELFNGKRSRQAIQNFLSVSDVKLGDLLRQQALYLLKKLGWKTRFAELEIFVGNIVFLRVCSCDGIFGAANR